VGQHTRAILARYSKDMCDYFELGNSRLHAISTDNASSNYSMTRKLQLTLDAPRIEWPSLRNPIPCMVHVIQLALGAFMTSLGVNGRTKSWEADERDQQFRYTKSIDIGKSQRLSREGNARVNKVSAMRPDLAMIIEKVRILTYFESPETDL